MKIWSLPKHETITAGKKYCGKEKKLLLRSNFSSIAQYFRYITNFKSSITHIFAKCGCSNYFFLNSVNPICRGTDISKYFRESLGIRDNGSLLYFNEETWKIFIRICLLSVGELSWHFTILQEKDPRKRGYNINIWSFRLISTWNNESSMVYFILFRLSVAFNNLSVIPRCCLDVTGNSMLTFRVLPRCNITPQTHDVVFHSLTFSMLSATRKRS